MLAGLQSTIPRSEDDARIGRERAAHDVLEGLYGRTLSDAERESIKRSLLTFVRLLMEWEQEAVDEHRLDSAVGDSVRS